MAGALDRRVDLGVQAWAVARSPEIDPGALRTALVLLAGGVLVLSDRYRRR